MRWQDALTKEQLSHLRWSRDGAAPSLASFKKLREHQAGQTAERAKMGLYAPLCCHCDRIEAQLKEVGKL